MKKCPLCEGNGYIKPDSLVLTIISLHKRGLTIREISSLVGKGTTTVHYHIHRYGGKDGNTK